MNETSDKSGGSAEPAQRDEKDLAKASAVSAGEAPLPGVEPPPKAAAGAAEASGSGPNPRGPVDTAVTAFFQELMQGLGRIVKQASAPQPAAQGGAPRPAEPSAVTAVGNLLSQLLQRALTPLPPTPSPQAPSRGPVSNPAGGPAGVEGAPAPPEIGPRAQHLPSSPPLAAQAVSPDPGDAKSPSLQLDLAGLLAQLTRHRKPPGT